MTEIDIAHLKSWIGRKEARREALAPFPANGLAATLDRADPPYAPGDPLPPLWHLVYALATPPQSGLEEDGHARRGGFLPPVPLPRRMWAGGRMELYRPLRLGAEVERRSEVASVALKQGRSGPLVFVTARFEFLDPEGVAMAEERDIVYREAPAPGALAPAPAPKPAPGGAVWRREIRPDSVLLFRYSALTFNGHRIHFDRDFCVRREGYPGLVVHGPLIATLLADLLRREAPAARMTRFSFRALAPLFDGAPFFVCGAPSPDGALARLWAEDAEARLAMEATASLEPAGDDRGGSAPRSVS